ncbi:MAG: LamG domain-containing protein [Bacteroidaceae bacterium]|nr:LamG domain-containing protein [Bacteroidaceae bacterium]
MEDKNNVLYLPFDESDGSTVAQDYSKSKKNATVTKCHFVGGKIGKAIEFDGNGHADIANSGLSLAGDFTIMAWVCAKEPERGGDGLMDFYFQWGKGVEEFTNKQYASPSDVWTHWAVVNKDKSITIYKDGVVCDTLSVPQHVIGFSMSQDIYSTHYGMALLDEVKMYDIAASKEDIEESMSKNYKMMYYLNGKGFIKEWSIYVQQSDGVLQRPKQKTRFSQDWPDMHGEVVDLKWKRLQSREISLKCFLPAQSKFSFIQKWQSFLSEFDTDGTARLMIDIHPTKPLVYEVYLEDTQDVSKTWNDDLMVGTFTLKVKEPDPVKRVVRFRGEGEKYIKLKSDKIVTVAWGDQTFTHNVWGDHTGDDTKVAHTYADADAVYYAIVSGVIEDITDFDTNGIVVWDKF